MYNWSNYFIMTIQKSLQLFDILNRNFKSESDARLFVTEIDTLISSSFKDEATVQLKFDLIKEIALSRTDFMKELAITNREIVILKGEIIKENAILKADLTKQIYRNKIVLITKIDGNKIELIKWIFSFWITIVLLIVSAFFLKK